jgi:lysozyme family protein
MENSMPTPKEITSEIISREGGFVNDPDDPGGATKFGVTIGTIKRLGFDADGDGRITENDVKVLTKEDAENIFLKHYFYRPSIDLLPAPIRASVYDMYVNSGGNAIRILQRLLNDMGARLKVDGAIGAKTLAAAEKAYKSAPLHIADAYGIARRNYYFRLGDKRPKSRKYCVTRRGKKGGWIRRAEEFISPTYHMSQSEFEERIAAWG